MAKTVAQLIADKKVDISTIINKAKRENRTSHTEQESRQLDALFDQLERLKEVQAETDEYAARDREVYATPAARRTVNRTATVHVGREARTYSQADDPHCQGKGFLSDVARSFLFGAADQSSERLRRHMDEERVERGALIERAAGDTTTTNWAGLTVPQYLTEFVAPAVANLRPFADICNHHPLPPAGLSVNYSRVTTASSAAVQATELTAVSATSLDDTLGTANILTCAGSQNVSRQAIDRGINIDDTVMNDLFSRYASALDNSLLYQVGTGLASVSASGVTYVDAAPTTPKLYSKILSAASAVETAMLGLGQPSHVIMHPRRWYYMSAAFSNTWPLVSGQNMPAQTSGVSTGVGYADGIRGVLPAGLKVIGDANVATNLGAGTEDEVYVVPQAECHLWEDPAGSPAFIRAEQPNAANLGVLLVVYGYYAFALNRYASGMQAIRGSGLIAPVFGS